MNHDDSTNDPPPMESDSVSVSHLTRASIFARLGSARPGEREMAWSEFRARYAPIIAGFAAKCGASRQDIDDIIQDVLTNFLGASGEFVYTPSKGRFRGYLKTCTVRAAIRRAGKNVRFRGVPLDEIPQAELAVEPIWDDLWEQQLVTQAELAVEPIWDDLWEQQLVTQALYLVREACQNSRAFRAFEQYVLLDRSAEIVAGELGTSVNNVHQAKTRITKQLRDTVQRLHESEEE